MINVTKKEKLSKFETYLLYFYIYAFIGWTCETLYAIYKLGHFVNRGFLFGPICPIYGYGAVLLLLFFKKYKNKSLKLFLLAGIAFSAFEYVASYVLEVLFAAHWWDYTGEFFNLNGRVTILFSVIWGIAAILFINHIHPFIEKNLNKRILDKIPVWVQSLIIKVFFSIHFIDTIFSFIQHGAH